MTGAEKNKETLSAVRKSEEQWRKKRAKEWKNKAILCNTFDADIAEEQWKRIIENFFNYTCDTKNKEKMDAMTGRVIEMMQKDGFTLYDAQMLIVSLGHELVRIARDDPMRPINQFRNSGYSSEP